MSQSQMSLIDSIRKRPAMYVGDVSERGLHELAIQVVQLSVSELLSGFGTHIVIRLCLDGSAEITDDGRAVSVTPLPEFEGQSRFEIAFTRIEAATTYRGPQRYRVGSGGLCGLGLAPLNALSKWLVAETADGAVCSRLRFVRGRCMGSLVQEPATWTGLRLRFQPDPDIFQVTSFDQLTLGGRLVELAMLNASLRLEFQDERSQQSVSYCIPEGMTALMSVMKGLSPTYPKILTVAHESERFRLHVAFQHFEFSSCRVWCYTNAILNSEGGSHWTGFVAGLTRAIEDSVDSSPEKVQFAISDLLNGLAAVVSIWVDDPIFEGPSRTKFAFAAIHETVESLVYQQLKDLFNREPEVLDAIRCRKRPALSKPPSWTVADIAAFREDS